MATMLAERGVPLEIVAAVIGHEAGAKDTRTLIRHYVRTDHVARKMQVLLAWDERLRCILAAG
jgi:intergrase/recombinase